MTYSTLAAVRNLIKGDCRITGKVPTRASVLQRVIGHPETVKRSYRTVMAEIRNEEKLLTECVKAFELVDNLTMESNWEKFRYEVLAVTAVSILFGICIGLVILI